MQTPEAIVRVSLYAKESPINRANIIPRIGNIIKFRFFTSDVLSFDLNELILRISSKTAIIKKQRYNKMKFIIVLKLVP